MTDAISNRRISTRGGGQVRESRLSPALTFPRQPVHIPVVGRSLKGRELLSQKILGHDFRFGGL